jgi:cold shock protein
MTPAGIAGGFSCRLNYFSKLIGETGVALGTVKWFNQEKGYGFIRPDGGGSDVFVHITAVEKAGYTGLADGARISYELLQDRKGKQTAQNLRLG